VEKQNILYVHSSDELYGADRSLLRLVRDLDRRYFAPTVVISDDVKYKERLLSPEIEEFEVKTITIPLAVLRRKYFHPIGLIYFIALLLVSVWRLSRLIVEYRIDIVHSNSSAVISGAWAAFVTQRPHIWHVREVYTSPRFLGKVMARLVSALSHRVIAVSGPVRANLIDDGCNPNGIVVIHNGIDLDKYEYGPTARNRIRTEFGIPFDAPTIGVLGRISSWKGQDVLIQAARQVVNEHPETFFVLVGGIVEWEPFRRDELLALVDKLHLTERVFVEGFRRDVPDLLASFDVFVLPSTRPDPYPTVVLEAMACGLPVIASAHGGVLEMVNEETGMFVPPEDPMALACSISRLITNPSLRSAMGDAALRHARANFATSNYVTAIENIYIQDV